jgi:glycosyltransferase involved in cell wall biosynthesis
MQQTSFPIEVILGEDESIDGTRDICIEYAKKYPQKIRLFLRDRRLSQLFDENRNFITMFNEAWTIMSAKGKYVAFCEGDDFWTDPLKLQKQVDFLEANQDFSVCHHNMQVIYEEIPGEPHLSNSPDQKEVTTILDLVKGNYIYNASCVFRNGVLKEIPELFFKIQASDYILYMLNAQFGKIRYFREPMGVYRVHQGGLWSTKDHFYHREKWAELLDLMKHYFSPEINSILVEEHNQLCLMLLHHFKNQPEKCKYYFDKIINDDPMFGVNLFNDCGKQKEEYEQRIKLIYNSWSYKIGNLIIRPIYYIIKFFKL